MKLIIIFWTLTLSNFAYATHPCSGKVNNVALSGPGNVHVGIAGIGAGNKVCSVTSTLGEYTAESCRAVFSMLLAAKVSEKNITLYFRNDTNTSCNKGNWVDFSSDAYQLYYVQN